MNYKTFKKMKNDKKDRTLFVNFDIYKNTKIIFSDGDKTIKTLEVTNLPTSDKKNTAKIELSHDRNSGRRKIITSYELDCPNIALSSKDVLDLFDIVFAIDTNAILVGDKRRCAGVVGILFYHEKKRQIALFKYAHIAFEINKDDKKFEKYSWKYLVENYLLKDDLKVKKIGLIVDAYLDDIKDFNAGAEILDDFQLPDNIKLIYASADKKGDGVLNWAINQCDRGATDLLKEWKVD